MIAPAAAIAAGATHPTNYLTYRVGASATSSFLSQDIFLDSTGNTLPGNKDFGIGASGDNAALVAPDGTDADRLSFGSDAGAVVAAPTNAGDTMSRCPDGTGELGREHRHARRDERLRQPGGHDRQDQRGRPDERDRGAHRTRARRRPPTSRASSSATLAAQSLTIGSANTTVGGSAGTTIPAGGYAEVSLGTALTPAAASDTVTLADGATTVDTSSWTSAFTPSWGRCPDGTGGFAQTTAITDGAGGTTAGANTCSAGSTTGYDAIRVSEIETNGDPLGDWIELTNIGSTDVNISGLYLADNGGTQGDPAIFPTDSGHVYQIPGTNQNPTDTTTAGNTVLPAHGYHAFFESNSFPFGLGNPDQARIFSPTKALIDATSWPLHESGATYVRCPGRHPGRRLHRHRRQRALHRLVRLDAERRERLHPADPHQRGAGERRGRRAGLDRAHQCRQPSRSTSAAGCSPTTRTATVT